MAGCGEPTNEEVELSFTGEITAPAAVFIGVLSGAFDAVVFSGVEGTAK